MIDIITVIKRGAMHRFKEERDNERVYVCVGKMGDRETGGETKN